MGIGNYTFGYGEVFGTANQFPKLWNLDTGDHVRSISVWHVDQDNGEDVLKQFTSIEIITLSRQRFWYGKSNESARKSTLELDSSKQIKSMMGYVINGLVVGLELEII